MTINNAFHQVLLGYLKAWFLMFNFLLTKYFIL
jgi:hypothetical protein